jgi:hypothetical protein
MDKKIVKVVYDNGEEKSIESEKIKSKEQIKEGLPIAEKQDYRVNGVYNRQFKELEEAVLCELDEDIVKRYAKDHLDLKDEDEDESDCDCEDKDVSDFEDDELMSELSRRNLLGYANINIISIDLFTRFSRVITTVNNQDLETIISDLETKYNL